MTIDVLGLGESIRDYRSTSNITIGVNDIYKFVKTDYLLVMDEPQKFTKERLGTILTSTPKKFYTNRTEWIGIVNNLEIFKTAKGRGSLKDIDDQSVLCHSSNSPYVAACLAHKMGAKKIVLYGVDFNTHNVLSRPDMLERIKKHFKDLNIALNKRGVRLFVSSDKSKLCGVLPLMNQ